MKSWKHRSSFILTAMASLAMACAPTVKRPIKENVSGPFAILSIPGRSDVLIVNSSTNGEYEEGSLALYSAENDGKLSLKETRVTERLGLAGAVSADGKLIAVSYVGKGEKLRFFGLENDVITAKPGLTVSIDGKFDQMRFFTPTSGAASDYYLLGSLGEEKIIVYRINAQGITRLFTLPDDMPGEKPSDNGYALALNAPVYIEKSDLLVGFPEGTFDTKILRPKDSAGEVVSPYKIVTGEVEATGFAKSSGDLRALSTLVIDFEKYLADGSLRNAAAYIPYIRYGDFTLPDPAVSEKDAKKTADYYYHFQNAKYVNEQGCVDRNPSSFDNDAVLLSEDDGKRGHIVQLGGWDTVKTSLANLEQVASGSDFNYRNKIIFQSPMTLKLYSSAEKARHGNSRTTMIQVLEQDSTCIPIWARIQVDGAVSGMEKATLVAQVGLATEKAIESSTNLVPRGIANLTAIDDKIFTSSYSFDVLKTFKFENGKFSAFR